jgi:hypothetical protein
MMDVTDVRLVMVYTFEDESQVLGCHSVGGAHLSSSAFHGAYYFFLGHDEQWLENILGLGICRIVKWSNDQR